MAGGGLLPAIFYPGRLLLPAELLLASKLCHRLPTNGLLLLLASKLLNRLSTRLLLLLAGKLLLLLASKLRNRLSNQGLLLLPKLRLSAKLLLST
jgi:hypothetical protein